MRTHSLLFLIIILRCDAASAQETLYPHVEGAWSYAEDRSKITIVDFRGRSSQSGYATTICEYQPVGRVVRRTLYLDGSTTFRTEEFKYDDRGRLVGRDIQSQNPDDNYTIVYTHSGNTVTQGFPAGGGGFVVRRFDERGDILEEETHRIYAGRDSITTLTFHRGPDEIRKCWSGAEPPGCVTEKFDRWGNVVERTSSFGDKYVARFVVDSFGNWTKRTEIDISHAFAPGPPPTRGRVMMRDITYAPSK